MRFVAARRANGSVSSEAETLQAYLRAIARFPRLTPEEERELGRRIRDHQDEEALRRLVESNLRFVVSYAKRYRGLGVPFLDLIHEGNLGLIEAARRFDPDRNVKFITYAVWWIRQAIMQALAEQSRSLALPPKVAVAAARYGRDVAARAEAADRELSDRELAEALDIAEADAAALPFIAGEDVSLSEPVGEEGEGPALGDLLEQKVIPPAEAELIRRTMTEHVRRALEELDEKERQVIALRYGLDGEEPKTLQQIGDRLHLSRERVRQIEARAKAKLQRSRIGVALRSYLN